MNMKRKCAALLAGTLACSMLLSGCGKINPNTILVNINKGEDYITVGYGNFVARYTQSLYDGTYLTYYGTTMWSEEEDGVTFEDSVKENIMNSMEEDYVLNLHADEYDIALTDEEKETITETAEKFMSSNDEETLEAITATQEIVEKFLTTTTIASRMEETIKESADVEVTEEEAAQRTFTYAYFNSVSYTDSDGNTNYYTDDEQDALEETANQLAASTDFDADAETLGASVSTHSYGSSEDEDDTMDTSILEAADALEEGEISDVITVDGDGFYVVRLDSAYDEEATQTKMESLDTQKRQDYYDTLVEGWEDEISWVVSEKQWAKVKFDTFFNLVEDEEEETDSADTTEAETSETETTEEDTTEEDTTEVEATETEEETDDASSEEETTDTESETTEEDTTAEAE